MTADRRTWPSTGEPADSTATEVMVAERFRAQDEARSEWLSAWLAREREQKAWKRSKASGRRRGVVTLRMVQADAMVAA